ncbi:MAG: hypothetical protein FWG30_11620 [Eubacteriaceae bacterium]|nr:hypothetical protein [Eubacteriaceae bacterium]
MKDEYQIRMQIDVENIIIAQYEESDAERTASGREPYWTEYTAKHRHIRDTLLWVLGEMEAHEI